MQGGGGVQGVSAMDLFPDGAFVRLRNRAQKTYLHADKDGEGVSLRPHGPKFPLNAVWRVQRAEVDGNDVLLLQGVAYGRYLAVSPDDDAPSGCIGTRAVQRGNYGPDNVASLVWRPFRMADDERHVRLRHGVNRKLRANGRFLFWHTAATVDTDEAEWSTMMQWTVGRFDLATVLPDIPIPRVILGRPSGLFRRRKPEEDRERTIRYVRANDEGVFDLDYNNWQAFPFYGRSVFNLMNQVGVRLPDGEVGDGSITLAVRPGSEGRLTPLVIDLPRSVATMDIVVFTTGSQGAQNFVYPDMP